MKKIVICTSLLIVSWCSKAQNAKITIVNNTDYDVEVTIYGDAVTSCSGATCNTTYTTNTIMANNLSYPGSPSTYGPYTPCAISTGVGWALETCSTSWCLGLPSDFQWSLAEINMPVAAMVPWPMTFPIYLCPTQPSCFGAGPYEGVFVLTSASPPFDQMEFIWSSSGGSLADVTITINQF